MKEENSFLKTGTESFVCKVGRKNKDNAEIVSKPKGGTKQNNDPQTIQNHIPHPKSLKQNQYIFIKQTYRDAKSVFPRI